jgi:hypothetical protein
MLQLYEEFLERQEDLHHDFEAAIAGLPVVALDWAPGPDMNSLCVLIVHTTGAEGFWIGDMVAGVSTNRNRAAEFQAKGWDEAALKQRLADSRQFARGVLEKLTLDDLSKACYSPMHDKTFSAAWSLLHALEHTGLHTGHAQITRQLWDQRPAQTQ